MHPHSGRARTKIDSDVARRDNPFNGSGNVGKVSLSPRFNFRGQ